MSFNAETIYQAIWDADQQQNGVPALLKSEASSRKDNSRGYVIVNEAENFTKDTKVLEEVIIPAEKKLTYNLCENLFNNYVLKSSRTEDTETESPEETLEINAFIRAIQDTAPMKIAREYLDPDQDDTAWFNSIREKWFTAFSLSSAKNRSGFEHIFVGENSGKPNNLGGYHFWYKYYIDDGAGQVSRKDVIDYLGAKYGTEEQNEVGRSVAEIVTLGYKWDPNDTEGDSSDDLTKRRGGFWVGCSPEGLIALGMARFKDAASGSQKAVINSAEYDIRLFTELDRRKESDRDKVDKYINTFYPIFKGKVGAPMESPDEAPEETSSADVKIIAALINPSGVDTGKENVTVINFGDRSVDITGWTISDKNGNFFKLDKDTLSAGEFYTATLPGTGKNPAQLGNKGGEITLKDGSDQVVDEVSYSRAQASKQGFTTLF